MRYYTVRAAIFHKEQQADGKKVRKLLKVATTWWLSNGEASAHFVSRFQAVLDALEAMIACKNEPEIEGIRQKFVKPGNILFLLLPADVLSSVNRSSRFLQLKNLIYRDINRKVQQLQNYLQGIQEKDGHLFKENALSFLQIIKKHNALGRQYNLVE